MAQVTPRQHRLELLLLSVLDVDGQEGLDTLADLEDQHRWLPVGPAGVTGTGGEHLFLAGDPRIRNSVKRMGPGLDTRAKGGLVVLPPSIHPNGNRYAWLPGRDPWACPVQPAPDWLIERLDPPRPAAAPREWGHATLSRDIPTRGIARALARLREHPNSSGQDELNRAAFVLGRFVAQREVGAREAGELLVDIAVGQGVDHDEAERIVLSAFRAALKGHR